MGPDGHTASWPPGDPVIDSERPSALSGEYQGRVRMTLTPGVVNAARGRVVLIIGRRQGRAPSRRGSAATAASCPSPAFAGPDTVVVLDPPAASDL